MAMALDLTGQRFGRLTALRRDLTQHKHGNARWICQCDCGGQRSLPTDSLRSGNTQSCGCLHREGAGALRRTHGQSSTTEYRTWMNIRQRCTNPHVPGYKDYGARGIGLDPRWQHDFSAFLAHLGPYPGPGYSVDRIDNERGYEPGNVRWVLRSVQNNNKRSNRVLTHDGRTMTLAQWARETGIRSRLIQARITRMGWDVDRALTTPPDPTAGRFPPGCNGHRQQQPA